MTRPLHAWIAFGLCLLVLLAAMGWVTRAVLGLERSEVAARRQAAVEESVRLALWRLDSALGPLLARESGRPPSYYLGAAGGGGKGEPAGEGAETGVDAPHVLLHFHLDPGGSIASPEAPAGKHAYGKGSRAAGFADRLAAFRAKVDPERLRAALDAADPPGAPPPALARAPGGAPPAQVQAPVQPPVQVPAQPPAQAPAQAGASAQPASQAEEDGDEIQVIEGEPTQQQAKQPLAQASPARQERVRQSVINRREWQARQDMSLNTQAGAPAFAPAAPAGLLRPLWIGDELVLARRASIRGGPSIQGLWLDWSGLEAWLLGQVKDLFPGASLEPARPGAAARESRRLAALPAVLVPGPSEAAVVDGLSPLRISLIIAWSFTLLGSLAAASLLRGVLALSERRAAFVSAVTHELRTPLTTFRMYTEMLAGEMVPAEKRRSYLETLSGEAARLTHLVSNVLAYARLEKGRPGGHLEAVAVGDLVAKLSRPLEERCARSLLDLAVEPAADLAAVRVRADPAAVEQVLFNLVDNACKYAGKAADHTIALEVRAAGRWVALRVRDRGPGIAEPARLFRPFSRSAREAAGSAPGVGLGLALSRRLARAMGGDLRHDPAVTDGACFELRLPRV